ncbi:AN1-type zinc finger protein 4 isoform X2 [Anguilla rostrata]|uniref:AN1-type zinc finger protein 4 isoform X2 n=1 Tax=Anguilla rostrata TaxID=7938 RepID=UPI0030D2F309
MTDRKEPPFFNEDNVGPFHFRLPRCESMELLIETLTGTRFQLRVSPFHTVVSVKAKIHRLEGIPVAQQHLIWNNVELEDEYCLYDYSIAEGSTLKLVLAMRGGPINTRRVAVDDSVKEMMEYMDTGRGGAWDEAPPNKQVTYLVYREGDQLNFFRVVDRGDGTLTPVRGSSVYNLYTEEEELGDSGSGLQALENSITMSKMRLLKAKMENMNLNKKPKKSAKLKPRPPGGPRTCSGYLAPGRQHRPFRVLPQIGQSPAPAAHLPPATGSAHPSLSSLPVPAPNEKPSQEPEGEEPWECPALGKILSPPKVSRLEGGRSEPLKDRALPPLSALATRGLPGAAEPHPAVGRAALMEESVLADPHKALPLDKKTPDPVTFDLPSQEVSRGDSLAAVAEQLPVASLLPQAVDQWVAGGYGVSTGTELRPLCASPSLSSALSPAPHPPPSPDPHLPPSPAPHPPPSPDPHLPPSLPAALSLAPHPPPSLPAALSPAPRRPPSFARLQAVHGDSPDVRPELLSNSEAQDVARITAKEPLSPLLASLSRRRSRGGGPGGLGRGCASIRLIQEDLLLSPSFMSVDQSAGALSSSGSQGPPTLLLPPVKGPPGSRKKSSRHCYLCRKKTGLASSFQCRCGNSFCASHRYAEAHDCSFDYKSAGRRFLQETNPVVTAPKLPKI